MHAAAYRLASVHFRHCLYSTRNNDCVKHDSDASKPTWSAWTRKVTGLLQTPAPRVQGDEIKWHKDETRSNHPFIYIYILIYIHLSPLWLSFTDWSNPVQGPLRSLRIFRAILLQNKGDCHDIQPYWLPISKQKVSCSSKIPASCCSTMCDLT